jgi:hypothetical protein
MERLSLPALSASSAAEHCRLNLLPFSWCNKRQIEVTDVSRESMIRKAAEFRLTVISMIGVSAFLFSREIIRHGATAFGGATPSLFTLPWTMRATRAT